MTITINTSAIKRFLPFAAILVMLLSLTACWGDSAANNQQAVDQANNGNAASRLHNAYPYPVLKTSSELSNEIKRYHLLNDDVNRISYVYLMGNGGQIIAEYQIIGKVSSTDSLYSSPASTDCGSTGVVAGSASATCAVLPSAQPDGSYGLNEPGIYFFVNDAQHSMVEWNGIYVWSSTQLGLAQPPEIVVVPNGH